jgi:UDP-4-amino-4,6-dideoxy-N-acetyl-beta-L-altrosamine transaminase
MTSFIPYGRQCIDEDDISAVVKVLKSDWITQGPAIDKFEKALADYCGSEYAVVFNSGTSALHGAYYSLGLKSGDELITSPITFAATANAGLYLGAKPVFADVEKDTGNLDISEIEKSISSKTKLIVPVHYAGHPVDMDNLFSLSRKHGIPVIEDACHALGAEYRGDKIGNCRYSEMTVLSFHPVKHITTGEGGAVLTNDRAYYEKMNMFRTHGITKKDLINKPDGSWYYEMQFLGYNYRITDIQAALGLSQLGKLGNFVSRRREIAGLYSKAFRDNPYFDVPPEKDYALSSYHIYPLRLKNECIGKKQDVVQRMKDRGVGTQVHYIPVYLQPYYKGLGYEKGLCPVAEDFYQREISIPIYPAMTDKMVNQVIDTIKTLYA